MVGCESENGSTSKNKLPEVVNGDKQAAGSLQLLHVYPRMFQFNTFNQCFQTQLVSFFCDKVEKNSCNLLR